jgi:hypothetical protein
MKMPATVIKKIVSIQREFLWGGLRGGRKMYWVSWKEVCKPKCQGGLGVRDVGKVNYSLLIKWRWRLLQNDAAFWKVILVAKCGPLIRHKVHWVGSSIPNGASAWWKDVCGIDLKDGVSWFGQNISRKIENGLSTRFWLDCWMGNSPLCEKFPRLFSISSHKEGLIGEYWEERGGGVGGSGGGAGGYLFGRKLSSIIYWRTSRLFLCWRRKILGSGCKVRTVISR